MRQLSEYHYIFFDCDGVVLNSNQIKSDAFRFVARHCKEEHINALLHYNRAQGGVSRYIKLEWFHEMLKRENIEFDYQTALMEFSFYVKEKLISAQSYLDELKLELKPNQNWSIVSGGDQAELREVFSQRGLDVWFDGGIHGSPKSKYDILLNFKKQGIDLAGSLFVGDSLLDYEVAKHFNTDFVFLWEWSEVSNQENFCISRGITSMKNILELWNL